MSINDEARGDDDMMHDANTAFGFDRAALLERLHDERLTNRVLAAFLVETPRLIEDVRQCLERGDLGTAKRKVHTLKGAAANVGGESVRVVAAAMEQAALAGDAAALGQQIPQLTAAFEHVRVGMLEALQAQTPLAKEEKLKILIVEDDFASRLILQRFLKDYGSVHVAVDGQEAVQAVRIALEAGEAYDMICMDIMMPEMDGLEALRSIRALEEERGIFSSSGAKIMMTTSLDDPKNVMTAFKGLCDLYLIKPIDKEKLYQAMEKSGLLAKTERHN